MLTKLYRQMEDRTEQCLYIASAGPLTEDEMRQIVWLAAETFEPEQTRFEPFLPHKLVLEIGPRLNVETPFSSNAVAICHAMGITKVTRIERSRRYPLSDFLGEAEIEREMSMSHSVAWEALVDMHLDPMTQVIYDEPLVTFITNTLPQPTRTIPILERGETADYNPC